jgi:hypothetical protein
MVPLNIKADAFRELEEVKEDEESTNNIVWAAIEDAAGATDRVAKIAKEMPDAVFSKHSLDKLDTYYLKFKLERNDILLDINLILPILKEKLIKHMLILFLI